MSCFRQHLLNNSAEINVYQVNLIDRISVRCKVHSLRVQVLVNTSHVFVRVHTMQTCGEPKCVLQCKYTGRDGKF
jgi:hypothetical protein